VQQLAASAGPRSQEARDGEHSGPGLREDVAGLGDVLDREPVADARADEGREVDLDVDAS